MTETLRLRCLRCGDWHEREVGDHYWPELCHRCAYKGVDLMFKQGHAAYDRWLARWMKAPANHPTNVALNAAWARWMTDIGFQASAAMEDP